MTDHSFNTIIDTSNVQLGQVIRTNISEQGIFRVFYNDICGNMYCALSRESNYKQVVYNSSQNRENYGLNDPIVDNSGMNAPFYGGTYHENELKHMDNSSNFYVFRYPTAFEDCSKNACDRGPISYFTEVQLQKYKHQGELPADGNKVIYNSQGNSMYETGWITAEGGNSYYDYNWYEQVAFGYCTTETGGYALDPSQGIIIATQLGLQVTGGNLGVFAQNNLPIKGLYAYPPDGSYPNQAYFGTGATTNKEMKTNVLAGTPYPYRPGVPASTTMAMYVPDLINLPYNTGDVNMRGVRNKPFNAIGSLYGTNSVRYITEPWQTDISGGNSAAGPSNLNVKYYISSKRPAITRLDNTGDTTNPSYQPQIVGDTDYYYKGRWSIYVDVKNQVYDPTTLLLKDNDTSGNVYISRSNRATEPVFTYPLVQHFTNSAEGSTTDEISNVFVDLDLDISKNSTINDGNYNNIYARPYFVIGSDISKNIVHGYAPYDLTVDNSDNIVINNLATPHTNKVKYCKIRTHSGGEWDETRWHIVYYAFNGGSINEEDVLGYATGILDGAADYNYLWNNFSYVQGNSGLYPSMELDSNGYPHIAFYGLDVNNDMSIHYISGENAAPINDTVTVGMATKSWNHQIIDSNPDPNNQYTDLSNNQPISLKISPYDDSTHICYQKFSADISATSIGYWTNSTNLRDISGVDGSLNYVGLHTQGKTIDISESYVEAYWDLSSAKCIFSRDYTRYDASDNKMVGLTHSNNQIQRYISPYGGRTGDFSNTSTYDTPITYKATHLDKIYVITRVKTPSSWSTYEYLFVLGGNSDGSTGAYFAGAYNGSPFFGVQSNYQSSSIIICQDVSSVVIPYKNGGSQITSNFVLATNRNYELEYYYNKTTYYAFIKVTDLDVPSTDIYEFYDISVNGGFNMKDGELSIGVGLHTRREVGWTGEIYKMSIYATDISNIPQFTLTRNGEKLDTSGNKYSSFFDNSGNKGLDIEPYINKYQVIDISNSLNGITCPADISGNSYVKSALLHDIYYYQLIPNQTEIAGDGQKIVAFDKFEDGTGIWACGYQIINGSHVPTVWVSNDNGKVWNTKPTPSSVHSQNYEEYFMLIKTYTDISGGKWVFVGGENSLLYVSNNYASTGQMGEQTLGNEWKIIGDSPCTNGTGDPSGRYFDKTTSPTNPPSGTDYPSYVSLCPVDINLTESQEIFGQDASSNAFHLWVGCWGYGVGVNKDILIRGNHVDYSNNTLDYSYNIITKAIENTNNIDIANDAWGRESVTSISFGGVDKGIGTGSVEQKILQNKPGLSYGIVGTNNYIYSTKNGGKTWDKKLATQRVETTTEAPNRFVRGTTGTYVEKNKIYDGISFVYDNSGMYVQTQAEPWISIPGFMVADNIGDFGFGNYDLSFVPDISSSNPKTITWDPSLNSNDYWNPLVLDNNGRGLNWKVGGGNNYKVYIDNNTSNFASNQQGSKEYIEETFTWDTTIHWYSGSNQGSVLYQKSSEMESQHWKKIEFSPYDISLNEKTTNQKFNWETMTPIDLSYSILHNDVYSEVLNDTFGFFKISRTPFVPNFRVIYSSGTQAYCLLTYKLHNVDQSSYPALALIKRLSLEDLNIKTKWYKRKVTVPISIWSSFGTTGGVDYNALALDLEAGSSYEFQVVLNNKYGDGWPSAVSDPISIPSPNPSISDLSKNTKLFENKIQWKPYIETDTRTGIKIKSVYSYDISKQYFDIGEWKDELAFCSAYTGLSGEIFFTQWNGPPPGDISKNESSTGLITDVTLIDTDISLNTMYRYGITPKGSGVFTQSAPFWITTRIDDGMPLNIKYEYFVNDASFNICWNKYQDISTNTTVTWDISWQEIQENGSTDNSGNHTYNDPSNNQPAYGTGKNYTRISGLPLPNSHLLADASYNYQIKGHYINSSASTQFDTSYNALYDSNGNKTLPITYYNYQQPPILNHSTYNINTDIIDINWNATTDPGTPYYYDISLSNTTINRTDYSYNIIVTNGNKLPDISNNGVLYYPGEYNVRVKAAYGDSVPTVKSLFSDWSNTDHFHVPDHLPTNFKVTPKNSQGDYDITDVSYVELTWDAPGKNISNNIFGYPPHDLSYSLIRKTANKTHNYIIDYSNNDISKTVDPFIDNNYPLGQVTTVPRIYRYDLSANYL